MNTPSAFDPNLFLQATTTEASERRIPLPPGNYTAIIEKLVPEPWRSKDGTKTGYKFNATLMIALPPQVAEDCKYTEPFCRLVDSIMLDMTPANTLDYAPGKNRALRMYREATDMNTAGALFSPGMLVGKSVLVSIQHKIWDNAPIEEIVGIGKVS